MYVSQHGLRDDIVRPLIEGHAPPLLFITVSGAHLYGFASPDSDYDLRGCHITPARDMLRLHPPSETREMMNRDGPIEIDMVTHDLRKFFLLLLKNNGYVLEQVFSPLVVWAGDGFDELRSLARGCITKYHHYHYDRFALSQWQIVTRKPNPTVKGLLYTYRVLLAGIHLLRTGEVESNLPRLNADARLDFIDDLIARKLAGAEKQELRPGEIDRHEREFLKLRADMEAARETSHLPEHPSSRDGLDDLLVRLRLGEA